MRPPRPRVLLALALCFGAVTAGCGSHSKHLASGNGSKGATAVAIAGRMFAITGGGAGASGFTPAPSAAALAAKLPLARQVSELFLVGVSGTAPGAAKQLGGVQWGGYVLNSSNFSNDTQVAALIKALNTRPKKVGPPPPLIAATQEGGPQTAFSDLPPEAEPAMAATGQPSTPQAQALQAGKRLRGLGVEMTLAPLADVDVPQGALTGRLFSTDPLVVARSSAAAVNGYNAAKMISAVGHFPGAGAASSDPDQNSATVGGTLAQLRGHDLLPFAAVTPVAPVIVMSNAAYVAFDGVTPASLLPQAVQLLRINYGFHGVVMSDDLDAALQTTGSTAAAAATQALQAGDDLLYITGPLSELQSAYQAVLSRAQSDPSVKALVQTALLRVLTLEASYGLIR